MSHGPSRKLSEGLPLYPVTMRGLDYAWVGPSNEAYFRCCYFGLIVHVPGPILLLQGGPEQRAWIHLYYER